MTLPNFLIIGAQKAGTTLLWDVVDQHPEIYMSKRKEIHYFTSLCGNVLALEGDRVSAHDLASYQSFFQASNGAVAIGEASTSYLHTPGVAEQIKKLLPDVKIISVLRNPVERAYSHYLFMVRHGLETEQRFADALAKEEERIAQGVPFGRYRQIGRYYEHLQRYLHCFPREQLHICLFEDLIKRPAETYAEIFDFLGVSKDFVADTSVRRNPSGIPKIRWLDRLISRSNPLRDAIQSHLPRWLYQSITRLRDANLAKPPMEPEVRLLLTDYFRSDIESLQGLLDRDLSKWLQ
jgi:hypothetical protein